MSQTVERMSESLQFCLEYRLNRLPLCMHYNELLEILHRRTGVPVERLRNTVGDYTYGDFARVFELNQQKTC